jgi:aminoglycoside 6'-N-acetyltransferase
LVDIPPGAIELNYLIAEPARRGHGLGTRLIETAVARTWIDHPCAPVCSSRRGG